MLRSNRLKNLSGFRKICSTAQTKSLHHSFSNTRSITSRSFKLNPGFLTSRCFSSQTQKPTNTPKKYNEVTDVDINYFKSIIGEKNVLTDSHDVEFYSIDWLGKYKGDSQVVLKPETTKQVSQILSYCNQNNFPVVPQGGNTSLVGGATPISREIVLTLTKMNEILSFDETQGILECDSGCVLETLMNNVSNFGYEIPYDLGARGSCTIGGNVSTHAGGINFVKHGPLRANVLGLEVVLADGRILDMMNKVRKDSTGPDLKQLFIQSEGTLGIITKVCLRCVKSDPVSKNVFLDVNSYEEVLEVLSIAKAKIGRNLAAIEYMDYDSYKLVHDFKKDLLDFPYEVIPGKFYVLIEACGSSDEQVMGY